MTATIMPNNRLTRDSKVPFTTLNDNGEPVKWRMFYDNNSLIADSDHLSDLVAVFIDGYEDKTEDEKRAARFFYMNEVQKEERIFVAATLTAEDLEAMTPLEVSLLEDETTRNISFEEDESMFVWKHKQPLILIDAYYPPYVPNAVKPLSHEGDYREVSNIIWLYTQNEQDFLSSLMRLGRITYGHPRSEPRVPASIRRAEEAN